MREAMNVGLPIADFRLPISQIGNRQLAIGNGFTLLELVLVMAIIATLMAVVTPTLSGFGAARQLDQAAAQLVALANWARDRAIQDGRIYRLNVDAATGVYWVSVQSGGEFVRPETDFGRLFELPENIACRWSRPNAEGRVQYVQFFPTGRTEPTTIELVNQRGSVRFVGALSAAERFSVLEAEQMW